MSKEEVSICYLVLEVPDPFNDKKTNVALRKVMWAYGETFVSDDSYFATYQEAAAAAGGTQCLDVLKHLKRGETLFEVHY